MKWRRKKRIKKEKRKKKRLVRMRDNMEIEEEIVEKKEKTGK